MAVRGGGGEQVGGLPKVAGDGGHRDPEAGGQPAVGVAVAQMGQQRLTGGGQLAPAAADGGTPAGEQGGQVAQ